MSSMKNTLFAVVQKLIIFQLLFIIRRHIFELGQERAVCNVRAIFRLDFDAVFDSKQFS